MTTAEVGALAYVGPTLGVVVSVGTLLFTALGLLQKADAAHVRNLLGRIEALEGERDAWDTERRSLHAQIGQLQALLLPLADH